MILLVDNYDSFTYNLLQLFGGLGQGVVVRRNDELSVQQVHSLAPRLIVISPGPGRPSDAGLSLELIRAFAGSVPIFGVCLGHQCIGEAFGAKVRRAAVPVHGKTSRIYHDGRGIFRGLPNPFTATRYHSLLVDDEDLPPALEVTAHTSEGEIMGLALKGLPVYGVQFHPESFLSEQGELIARNLLELTAAERAA